jgi:hypothetical protein
VMMRKRFGSPRALKNSDNGALATADVLTPSR